MVLWYIREEFMHKGVVLVTGIVCIDERSSAEHTAHRLEITAVTWTRNCSRLHQELQEIN